MQGDALREVNKGLGPHRFAHIATAKINGAEPFAYLQATLEAIAADHPASRLYKLLPWNFQPSS
ncbi:transposase domain-containing protein [Leisingera caerulea]|nr:transposase domain-containing protein [Leisingera caerulea]